jgi:hypothetical protein
MMGAADNTYDRKRGRFENRLVGMIREEIYSYVAHKNDWKQPVIPKLFRHGDGTPLLESFYMKDDRAVGGPSFISDGPKT